MESSVSDNLILPDPHLSERETILYRQPLMERGPYCSFWLNEIRG